MVPLPTDICLHAIPCLSLLADFFLFERKYGRMSMTTVAPILSLLCTAWYGWWVERCASFNGHFPYPFLTMNPFEIRVRIYGGAGIMAYGTFYALNALHK
ncbi:MFS general substrate transporter [Mycena kentingensis (nom. inval.)]|nr:MFS general substrate transporter [Mycena kentingensis (nom. inval.)]